jgi:hypothetical protein
MVRHFVQVGFIPPWVGYVAIENSTPVVTKSPPVDGGVRAGTALSVLRDTIFSRLAMLPVIWI